MIPSEVVIDGVGWTIDDCNTLSERTWGETNKATCRILLSADLCPAMKELTFWHELIHAIFAMRDIRLHSEAFSGDLEEDVASMLGPALRSFMLDNAEITWRYESRE